MGSSISRGRKFSPTKSVSDKNPSAYLEHAKFMCGGDASIQSTEFVEGVVCKENEIEENGMKVVDLGSDGGKVLLVKQKGKISALGTKCTHYGAPLVNGHLGDGRIRCQWHGACFNINTGDIEDFPGLDSLPCYQVKIKDGNVTVRANKELLAANRFVNPFVKTINPTKATFIVAGGGPAGHVCVETLRKEGFDGRIVFICAENYLPYDRIKLSKILNVDVNQILLRSADFYRERNIEVMLGMKLMKLNPSNKKAILSDEQVLHYDKIFLATGSRPRHLEIRGCELKNIFYLRSADDANMINQALSSESEVVILGASFIGMEVAAYCVGRVHSVTVVGKDIPFKASFGPVIGQRIVKLYEEKKVQFRYKQWVRHFEGDGGKLKSVILDNGAKLPCDVCIIGIGVVANTCYLESSGIERQSSGTVEVNEFLQTQFPDVYVGGDIAKAPVLGDKASIGHWGLANYHGQIAAYNMMGQKKPLRAIPFFWTVLLGKGFRYAGYGKTYDDIVIDGSVEDFKFIAFYCDKNVVVGVNTIGRDPLAAKFAEMLYEGKQLQKDKIKEWLSSI